MKSCGPGFHNPPPSGTGASRHPADVSVVAWRSALSCSGGTMPGRTVKTTKQRAGIRTATVSVAFGAALAAMAPPIGIGDHNSWITVKSAFASHDKSNDSGVGHDGAGGGDSGSSGSRGNSGPGNGGPGNDGPGNGGPGDDDNGEDGGSTGAASNDRGRDGSASAEATEVEDSAVASVDSVDPVNSDGPPSSDTMTDGVPTIQEVFALSADAVIGPAEERALIANGWTVQ